MVFFSSFIITKRVHISVCNCIHHKASIPFGVVQQKRTTKKKKDCEKAATLLHLWMDKGRTEFLFDLHRNKLKLKRNRNENFCTRTKLTMTFRIIILSNQPGLREYSESKEEQGTCEQKPQNTESKSSTPSKRAFWFDEKLCDFRIRLEKRFFFVTRVYFYVVQYGQWTSHSERLSTTFIFRSRELFIF